MIVGDILEEAVLNIIKTHVLTEDNLRRCEAAYRSSLEGEMSLSPNRRADDIRRKIERASMNLALAEDSSDFAAISKQMREWRKELKKLAKEEVAPRVRSPLQGMGIEDMKSAREFLETADRGKLSDALHNVIESVVITKVKAKTILKTARVSFHPESYSGSDIEIPAETLRARNGGYLRVPAIVASFGRPVSIKDVMAETGLTYKTVAGYMKQLTCEKLLNKTSEGFVCR